MKSVCSENSHHKTLLANNLYRIQERVAAAVHNAHRSDPPTLVAISKLQPLHSLCQVATAGQVDFGENYVQEACGKQDAWSALNEKDPTSPSMKKIRWHFTGHIQSRKAKDIVGRFQLIHSVDSEKLATALNRYAAEKNLCQAVLIQVNVGEEEQKAGVMPEALPKLTSMVATCPHLDLQGFMCLPPVFDAGLAARPHFALLRELCQNMRCHVGLALPHLSMGMSGDLEAAILEGATLVRVGTDIFGAR